MLRHRPAISTRSKATRRTLARFFPPLLLLPLIAGGCSIKGMAINSVADALSGKGGGSNVYLTDNDPILVGEALPFSLKLMETILQETPEHEGLLVAAASGFVMYGTAWVLRPARVMEATDLRAARVQRARAKALFLRARGYAGRVYWFAAAQGSALTSDLNDMDLLTDFTVVPVLLRRALELDEEWNHGALHELMMAMPTSHGISIEDKERHFARAIELNGGSSVAPLVSLAESVAVAQQDRNRFIQLLNEAMEFDVNDFPDTRLANVLAQNHARWLLSRVDELFLMNSESFLTQSDPTKVRVLWPLHF